MKHFLLLLCTVTLFGCRTVGNASPPANQLFCVDAEFEKDTLKYLDQLNAGKINQSDFLFLLSDEITLQEMRETLKKVEMNGN